MIKKDPIILQVYLIGFISFLFLMHNHMSSLNQNLPLKLSLDVIASSLLATTE